MEIEHGIKYPKLVKMCQFFRNHTASDDLKKTEWKQKSFQKPKHIHSKNSELNLEPPPSSTGISNANHSQEIVNACFFSSLVSSDTDVSFEFQLRVGRAISCLSTDTQ